MKSLIKKQLEKIAKIRADLRRLDSELVEAKHGLKGLVFDYINTPHIKKSLITRGYGIDWPLSKHDLTLSGWDCEESPTGKCVQVYESYDEICVFCGKPDERL